MASEPGPDSEEKLEKKDASKREIKNIHPYHLRNSDNLGTSLVTTLLNGENYRTWEGSVKTTLCTKTKLSFIDGTIKKLSTQF